MNAICLNEPDLVQQPQDAVTGGIRMAQYAFSLLENCREAIFDALRSYTGILNEKNVSAALKELAGVVLFLTGHEHLSEASRTWLVQFLHSTGIALDHLVKGPSLVEPMFFYQLSDADQMCGDCTSSIAYTLGLPEQGAQAIRRFLDEGRSLRSILLSSALSLPIEIVEQDLRTIMQRNAA